MGLTRCRGKALSLLGFPRLANGDGACAVLHGAQCAPICQDGFKARLLLDAPARLAAENREESSFVSGRGGNARWLAGRLCRCSSGRRRWA